jgi:hypothetical protein
MMRDFGAPAPAHAASAASASANDNNNSNSNNNNGYDNPIDLVDIDKIAQEVLTPATGRAFGAGAGAGSSTSSNAGNANAKGKAGNAQHGGGGGGVKKDATAALYPIDMDKLPSCTSDRICLLGCLAGVLSSGGTARFAAASASASGAKKKSNANLDDTSSAFLYPDDDDEVIERSERVAGVGVGAETAASAPSAPSSRRNSSMRSYFNDTAIVIATATARQTLMNTTFRQRAVDVNQEMLHCVVNHDTIK